MRKIVIGSRESRLAVVQTELVCSYIEENCPDIRPEILTMKTTGDRILDRTLDQVGGKGLFVKELDRALMDGRSDLSVHSLKDMPMETPGELPILGFSKREDERDVLVLPKGAATCDKSLPFGCSSKRRSLQLRALFPDMEVKSIRGNVLTRLEKLDRGEYAGLILAAAGLKRLGLQERISRYFTVEEMLPAAGQGVLAIQGRRGADYRFLEEFFDRDTACAVLAERAFVRTLNGGCSSPVAAHAVVRGEELVLTGLYYEESEDRYQKESMTGNVLLPEQLGTALAEKMRKEAKGCE